MGLRIAVFCICYLDLQYQLLKILTESPTVPRPNITTLDPFVISATFQAAPRPKDRSTEQRNKWMDDQISSKYAAVQDD
jgi:hypothetical protein